MATFEEALAAARKGRKPRSSSFKPGEYIYFKPAGSTGTATGYLGQSCSCGTYIANEVTCNTQPPVASFDINPNDWYLYKHDIARGEVPYYPDQFDMVKAV